jgi:FkbM family methyltransferase
MTSSNRMKRVLKRWLPPIVLDFARVTLHVMSRPVKETGFQEFECLGLRWRLDMASAISRAMVSTGVWEPDTTNVVFDLVKPDMNVLAVGANFGYYALLMAQRVGAEGHVWAFEPTLKFREQLIWHVKTNGFANRVTIVPFGLSDSIERLPIGIVSQTASLHFPPNLCSSNELIQLKPLDAVASELGIERIDFIQMDIDGHEAAFLRGAVQTLRNNLPPIALEFAQSCLHFAGSDVREVAALLREVGYEVCSEKTRKPYKDEFDFLLDCGNFDRYSNALAMRPERAGALFHENVEPKSHKALGKTIL